MTIVDGGPSCREQRKHLQQRVNIQRPDIAFLILISGAPEIPTNTNRKRSPRPSSVRPAPVTVNFTACPSRTLPRVLLFPAHRQLPGVRCLPNPRRKVSINTPSGKHKQACILFDRPIDLRAEETMCVGPSFPRVGGIGRPGVRHDKTSSVGRRQT